MDRVKRTLERFTGLIQDKNVPVSERSLNPSSAALTLDKKDQKPLHSFTEFQPKMYVSETVTRHGALQLLLIT